MSALRHDLTMGSRVVVGRGWRRALMLLLVVVPVMLVTAGASIVSYLTLSPAQQARATMANADLWIYSSRFGAEPAGLSQTLGRPLPGARSIQVYAAPALSLVAGGLTQQVGYRETAWRSPVARGWVRVTSGHLPRGASEAAVSTALARQFHLRIGDRLRYQYAPARPVIVGVVQDDTAFDAQFVAGGPGLATRWMDPRHPEMGAAWFVDSPNPVTTTGLVRAAARHGFGMRSRSAVLTGQRSLLVREPGLLTIPGLVFLAAAAAAGFAVRLRRLDRQLALLAAVGYSRSRIARISRLAAGLVGLLGAVIGVLAGEVLSWALRPFVRSAMARELASVWLPWRVLVLIAGAAVGCMLLGAWLPTRAAARRTVRSQLNRAPRPATASSVRRGLALGFLVASAVIMVMAANAGSASQGTMAGVLFAVLTLLVVPDLLLGLGRIAGPLALPVRFAFRDLARERRRPAAIVGFGATCCMVAIGVAVFVGSHQTFDARTYVGSRHLNQVEVYLDHPSQAANVRALVGALLHALTSMVYEVDTPGPKSLLTPEPAQLLSTSPNGLSMSATTGGLQIVDNAAQFRALTTQPPSRADMLALRDGKVLAFSRYFVRAGRAHLIVRYDASGNPTKSIAAKAAVATEHVDDTTLIRARGVISSATAGRLGLVARPLSVLAAGDSTPPAQQVDQLEHELQAIGVATTSVHVERGFQGSVPARWQILLLMCSFAVLISCAFGAVVSAHEMRPQLRTLRVTGFGGQTQRLIVATQASVLAGISILLGFLGGWVFAEAQLVPAGVPARVSVAQMALSLVLVMLVSGLVGWSNPPVVRALSRERARPGWT